MPYDTSLPPDRELLRAVRKLAKPEAGLSKQQLAANSQAAKKITDLLVRHCASCNRPSSKARLFQIREGLLCLACMGGGMSVAKATELEREYLDYMEREANKPPPKGYGDFS